MLKINENWIVFFDLFSKNNNGDSIRPIAEELRRQRPDFKFFFTSKHLKQVDMADEVIKPHTLKFNYVLAKSKYLVSPMGFPRNKKKRDGQIWVHTWHGTPLKKLDLSVEVTPKAKREVKQFEQTDLFCSSCEFCHEAFFEAMNIKEEQFIDSGLPRNDILQNYTPELIKEIKAKLNLPKDKKILFYCPTWRRYDYKANLPMDIKKMKQELGNEYCLLIRSHVGKHQWVDENDKPIIVEDGEFCFNVGNYPEISHLYLISDIHITDYSSSMFDFAILNRPQIFYAYDLDKYQKDFPLYLDYQEIVPGPVPINTDELIESIKNPKDYSKEQEEFKNRFCTYEKGDAAKKVVDEMLKRGES